MVTVLAIGSGTAAAAAASATVPEGSPADDVDADDGPWADAGSEFVDLAGSGDDDSNGAAAEPVGPADVVAAAALIADGLVEETELFAGGVAAVWPHAVSATAPATAANR